MAMIASKGPEDADEDPVLSRFRAVRSVVEEPRRSPAPREEEVVDWIWEAEKSLGFVSLGLLCTGEGWWGENALRASYWQLPGAGYGLHDDIGFLYAGGEEFGFCTSEQGLDYCCFLSVLPYVG